MSRASTSATTPLADILPWGPPLFPSHDDAATSTVPSVDRTLLVTDAASTDGRFLLHALALQFLSSRCPTGPSGGSDGFEGAVLWITCTPVTERHVLTALRRGRQHNLGGGGGAGLASGRAEQGGSGRIHVVSVPLELADRALEDEEFSHEGYLRQLHRRVAHWLEHRELMAARQCATPEASSESSARLGPSLIVVDNATTLASLFGDKLAHAFLSSVRSSLRKHTRKDAQPANTQSAATITNLLAIRANSPDDGGLYSFDDNDGRLQGEKLRSEHARLLRPWFGYGSGIPAANGDGDQGVGADVPQMEEQAAHLSLSPNATPSFVHTRGLYELADGIVDVSPLESGYARDVIGRLSFTATWGGKGWWGIAAGKGGDGKAAKWEESDGAYASLCVNYRCDDAGVRAMRLRSR